MPPLPSRCTAFRTLAQSEQLQKVYDTKERSHGAWDTLNGAIAASRNEAANENRRPTSIPSAGKRRAYDQGAIASYIMALEIAALIALAITLHLAKR